MTITFSFGRRELPVDVRENKLKLTDKICPEHTLKFDVHVVLAVEKLEVTAYLVGRLVLKER